MFTKIQAIIPIEGPRSFEKKSAQLDVDGDTGTVEILCQDHEMADDILTMLRGGREDFEMQVEISFARKKDS